ncbi:hypothetical protein NQ315_017347 [Exocentrus adspersus]|uniref:Uncharacterized protein n=1 Tax=Exocentrus adspersus TaxID=1586481 RepID=A0AAV8VLJ0_9CUCU|nr:hypothetical protein NQ315_017347 [Exocentrus adspersus]
MLMRSIIQLHNRPLYAFRIVTGLCIWELFAHDVTTGAEFECLCTGHTELAPKKIYRYKQLIELLLSINILNLKNSIDQIEQSRIISVAPIPGHLHNLKGTFTKYEDKRKIKHGNVKLNQRLPLRTSLLKLLKCSSDPKDPPNVLKLFTKFQLDTIWHFQLEDAVKEVMDGILPKKI